MYSHGLYPLINNPTCVAQLIATIFDNVFTNNITHETVNGIITTDISDNLPVQCSPAVLPPVIMPTPPFAK